MYLSLITFANQKLTGSAGSKISPADNIAVSGADAFKHLRTEGDEKRNVAVAKIVENDDLKPQSL